MKQPLNSCIFACIRRHGWMDVPFQNIEHNFAAQIADQITEQGWAVVDDFFTPSEVHFVREWIDQCWDHSQLCAAKVGKSHEAILDTTIRGDFIHWIDFDQIDSPILLIKSRLDYLKQLFNETFFAGIVDYECMMAVYPPGASYQKHVDAFKNDDSRVISVIMYFNTQHNAVNGGQLRIFPPNSNTIDIEPQAGKMVCFRSNQIPHEVLKTSAKRYSITAWLRKSNGALI